MELRRLHRPRHSRFGLTQAVNRVPTTAMYLPNIWLPDLLDGLEGRKFWVKHRKEGDGRDQAFPRPSSHEHALVPAPPPFAEGRLTMTFLHGTLHEVSMPSGFVVCVSSQLLLSAWEWRD